MKRTIGIFPAFLSLPALFSVSVFRIFSISSSNCSTPPTLEKNPAASPDFSRLPGARSPPKLPPQQQQQEIRLANPLHPVSHKDAKEAFKICTEMVAKRDRTNYLAALMMPKAVQAQIFALLAFNVELASIRDQIERNAGTAGIYRLQFWKDAIDVIYGKSRGLVPRQPVATALNAFAFSSDPLALQALVSVRQKTLGDRPFVDLNALEAYGREANGQLLRLIVEVLMLNGKVQNRGNDDPGLAMVIENLGNDDPGLVMVIENLATAVGCSTHLRATVPLLSRGIVLLPVDLMTLHGLSADVVYNRKKPDALKDLVRDIVKAIEHRITTARQSHNQVPMAVRPAFLASGVAVDNFLTAIKKAEFDLFDGRLQRNYPLEAWQLVWRYWRRRF